MVSYCYTTPTSKITNKLCPFHSLKPIYIIIQLGNSNADSNGSNSSFSTTERTGLAEESSTGQTSRTSPPSVLPSDTLQVIYYIEHLQSNIFGKINVK